VAVLGENFQVHPKEFERARDEFDEEIVAYGYTESLTEYHGWLKRGDIVVSTANQENFGLSVMEAMAAGCLPLLPNRLSYPEIIPQWAWSRVLYHNDADLADRLSAMLTAVRTAVRTAEPWIDEMQEKLSQHAAAFRWEKRIAAFDALFERARSEGGMR
jgi:glycosyltransferase involved in cell wall biosynthesis